MKEVDTDKSQHDDDEAPVRFTLVDILRMLAGLALAYCFICKFFTGSWYSQPFRPTYTEPSNQLETPTFWLENYGEIPVEFTLEELSRYSGQADSARILLSIKGHVFDVTKGSKFYGKWGPYKKFTGLDCSRLFSYPHWDLSALNKKCSHDLSDLTPSELKRVDSWLLFFQKKYPEIGYVKNWFPLKAIEEHN